MKVKKTWSIIRNIFIVVFTILMSLPIYLLIVNTFKHGSDIMGAPFALPSPFTLENLKNIFNDPHVNVLEMYLNTIFLTIFGTVVNVFISSLGSYYLVRSKSKLAKNLYMYFLLGLMVPFVIVYIPLVIIYRSVGLVGNLWALIFVFAAASCSFSTFMYCNFIKSVPRELEEAALIDGATPFQTFYRIVWPLLKPCTTTVVIFVAAAIWNDFLTPMLVGQVNTITVGIYTSIGPYTADWGRIFGFVFCGSIPVVIMYMFLQKYFISGLTAGAVKG